MRYILPQVMQSHSRAVPEAGSAIPEADRTLQIEAKKVADDQKSSAEIKVLTADNEKAQTITHYDLYTDVL